MVILLFLGGIYWGWEFVDYIGNVMFVLVVCLIIGVVLFIFGWVFVLLLGVVVGIGLVVCFLVVFGYDIW